MGPDCIFVEEADMLVEQEPERSYMVVLVVHVRLDDSKEVGREAPDGKNLAEGSKARLEAWEAGKIQSPVIFQTLVVP